MKAKDMVTNILQENKKLKEEIKMTKLKENEAKVDVQATPPDVSKPTDGAVYTPLPATQDDMSAKYAENEAKLDTQNPAKVTDKPGTGLVPTGASQDDLTDKYPKATMEKVGQMKQMKYSFERFREMDDSMDKITDILESIMARLKIIEDKLGIPATDTPTETPAEAPTETPAEKPAEAEEEPIPPMTESMKLNNVFTETMKTGSDDFGKIVKKILY